MIAGQRKNEVVAEVSQKNKDSLTIDFQLFKYLLKVLSLDENITMKKKEHCKKLL